MTEDFTNEVLETEGEFLVKTKVALKHVRASTGKVSHVAGIAVRLQRVANILSAAGATVARELASTTTKSSKSYVAATKRFRLPLIWPKA